MEFSIFSHEKTAAAAPRKESELVALMDKNGIGTDASIPQHVQRPGCLWWDSPSATNLPFGSIWDVDPFISMYGDIEGWLIIGFATLLLAILAVNTWISGLYGYLLQDAITDEMHTPLSLYACIHRTCRLVVWNIFYFSICWE